MTRIAIPPGVAQRQFFYSAADWDAWNRAKRTWVKTGDPKAWGRFEEQASSGRYLFTHRPRQENYHFGETLVAAVLEQEGYKCWTTARIIRRRSVRKYADQTAEVESLLQRTVGRVPQREYEPLRESCGLHLKTVDVVGYKQGSNSWVFCEVKRERDLLMPEQAATLAFLRKVYSADQAEVLVASVVRDR